MLSMQDIETEYRKQSRPPERAYSRDVDVSDVATLDAQYPFRGFGIMATFPDSIVISDYEFGSRMRVPYTQDDGSVTFAFNDARPVRIEYVEISSLPNDTLSALSQGQPVQSDVGEYEVSLSGGVVRIVSAESDAAEVSRLTDLIQ